MSDRQNVTRQLFCGWTDETMEKPVDEFLAWIRSEADGFGEDVAVQLEYERGSYDCGDSFTMRLVRPETDEEVAAREATEAANSARYRREAEARERAAYEALKAKFEKQ